MEHEELAPRFGQVPPQNAESIKDDVEVKGACVG
jgi:hypothetical protein